jgi:hypothetical protein
MGLGLCGSSLTGAYRKSPPSCESARAACIKCCTESRILCPPTSYIAQIVVSEISIFRTLQTNDQRASNFFFAKQIEKYGRGHQLRDRLNWVVSKIGRTLI